MKDPRSEKLFKLIQTAYNDQPISEIPELKDLLFTSAQRLDNDEDYLAVILPLSHGISQYYLKQHYVPEGIQPIYDQIKADVHPEKLNEKELRQFELAKGLASVSITFGGLMH